MNIIIKDKRLVQRKDKKRIYQQSKNYNQTTASKTIRTIQSKLKRNLEGSRHRAKINKNEKVNKIKFLKMNFHFKEQRQKKGDQREIRKNKKAKIQIHNNLIVLKQWEKLEKRE